MDMSMHRGTAMGWGSETAVQQAECSLPKHVLRREMTAYKLSRVL